MKKTKISFFIAAIVAAVSVAGCGSASNGSDATNVTENASSTSASQALGEKSTITVPSVTAVSNLDQTVILFYVTMKNTRSGQDECLCRYAL